MHLISSLFLTLIYITLYLSMVKFSNLIGQKVCIIFVEQHGSDSSSGCNVNDTLIHVRRANLFVVDINQFTILPISVVFRKKSTKTMYVGGWGGGVKAAEKWSIFGNPVRTD